MGWRIQRMLFNSLVFFLLPAVAIAGIKSCQLYFEKACRISSDTGTEPHHFASGITKKTTSRVIIGRVTPNDEEDQTPVELPATATPDDRGLSFYMKTLD
jgi:hypothetical protein